MSVSVTLKSYFYEVLIPSSQKNTSSPIEDILHHVSISFMKKLALYKSFNPRTHTGCDKTEPPALYNQTVSIHAPTRGATVIGGKAKYFPKEFQSTHPHGVRRSETCFCQSYRLVFQSTHPHGVRRHSKIKTILDKLFQSTHPHGVRQTTLQYYSMRLFKVSIHAPTRGATHV